MIRNKSMLLGALAATGSIAAAQPVTYDFSGTLSNHFVPFIDDAEVLSSQSSGVLRFDTGNAVTTLDPADAYAHTTFTPSYTESWTASIDFELPLVYDSNFIPTAIGTHEISLGIAAVFTAGGTTFNAVSSAFEVYHPGTNFGSLERQNYVDVVTNDIPSEITGAENWAPAPGVSTGTLRVSFDAVTKVLSAIDGNGNVLITADIDSGATNWGMTDTDTFQIGIYGVADNRAILTSTPITLDNFSGEILVPDATYDFSGVLGDNFSMLVDDPSIFSQQAVGVLQFDTGSVNSGGSFIEIFRHNTFAPRFDQSWTASIDFDLPIVYDTNYIPSTTTEQGIGMGIAAATFNGLGGLNGFAVNMEVWSDGTIFPNPRRQYYTSTFINGIDFPEAEVPAAGVTTGTLKLTFDAATKIITATNASGLVLLSSDLDAPGSDLGMVASDTFSIGIFGAATNRTIFADDPLFIAGPISIDNFSATITGGGPSPCLADTNGDGLLDNGDIQTFVQLFLTGNLAADMNNDGLLDNGDIQTFVQLFLAGCP